MKHYIITPAFIKGEVLLMETTPFVSSMVKAKSIKNAWGYDSFVLNRDAFAKETDAISYLEKKRLDRIADLERQLAKFKKLQFKIVET